MTPFLKQLCDNFQKYENNVAFCIDEILYTYSELGTIVGAIQQKIAETEEQQYFGVVARDSIYTFATIFALWLSGKTSVPISPKTPKERNQYILDQVNIKTIFDAGEQSLNFNGKEVFSVADIKFKNQEPKYIEVSKETDLYLLFTSGSTGLPKGVRISQNNLNAYLNAFFNCGYEITENDKCIEVFELTFDASVQCYSFPLMQGASVYTLPDEGIRFLSILKIMQKHNITFVKMTPSAIYYLQPYFNKINLPDLKYCLFGAEAFPVDLISKWESCVPNATIHNVYGPTETTINCTFYEWNRGGINKSRNGIATIGHTYTNMEAIVCDEQQNELAIGEKGELCLCGPQVTKGYWENPENNKKAFFIILNEGIEKRFYRTGDIVIKDEDGDLLYVGRFDSQIQIDGHRIELGEIENHAFKLTNVKCIALVRKENGLSKTIVLVVESLNFTNEFVIDYLRNNIPQYMIPKEVVFVEEIPLLSSGKTDKQQLLKMI